MRESPSLVIMDKLRKKGVKINYHDPYISKIPKTRNYNFDLKSIQLSKKKVSVFDAVVICTAHTNVNYELIEKSAKLIIDTRNVYKIKSKKIVRA